MFHEKMKALKVEMRSLNRDMFGDLPGRVKTTYEDLCKKQTEAMQNPQASTFEPASGAWEHWHHISGLEEQFYYQKSRVQWLGFGDRNSRFFHRVTQSRNVRNTIRKIVTPDGTILTFLQDIKRDASAHFEAFLNGSPKRAPCATHEVISELVDHHCSSEDTRKLMQPIQDDEIKEVLFSMPCNKASGPDGFPMEFL